MKAHEQMDTRAGSASLSGDALDPRCDAIILVGFGGPTSSAEIRPFLDRVLQGRPVPRERYEEVVHHYELLGGRSPYNDLTMRQAAALRERLRSDGIDVPVVVAMRNAAPFIDDALRDLSARQVRRVFGFILAAHRCEASWERYQSDLRTARERLGAASPEIDYPAPWHSHPLFVAAAADRARAAIAQLTAEDRERAELIFTAHSIPFAMAARAPYVEQLKESAALVAAATGRSRWRVAYQSRSGNPREPWLEPDVNEVLRELSGAAAIVIPIGFLCDHVEVLYDLDIEAAQIARAAGVTMVRAVTVSDHPDFIEMMAALARPYLKSSHSARSV
ncbi:MAG TPA: ferrochelatase [Candidatus Binataceae bacterium]|nr:ferrochelatase [Candidatus Binataceae bacterium]